MRIKKNDNVYVISGKDKGKKGIVLKAFPRGSRVIIADVNMKKRHVGPRMRGKKGEIVSVAEPIHVSNVMLADPKEGKPTRIGRKYIDGTWVRIAKKSGASLDT